MQDADWLLKSIFLIARLCCVVVTARSHKKCKELNQTKLLRVGSKISTQAQVSCSYRCQVLVPAEIQSKLWVHACRVYETKLSAIVDIVGWDRRVCWVTHKLANTTWVLCMNWTEDNVISMSLQFLAVVTSTKVKCEGKPYETKSL